MLTTLGTLWVTQESAGRENQWMVSLGKEAALCGGQHLYLTTRWSIFFPLFGGELQGCNLKKWNIKIKRNAHIPPLYRNFHQFCPEVKPDQLGDIVPPAGSGSYLSLFLVGEGERCPSHLDWSLSVWRSSKSSSSPFTFKASVTCNRIVVGGFGLSGPTKGHREEGLYLKGSTCVSQFL